MVDSVKTCRLYERDIVHRAGRLVLTFRRSIDPMLESLPPAALDGAVAIWSQWHGYLDHEPGAATRDFCRTHGISLVEHHTSGHASVDDLRRLATAINPRRLVPIHTNAPEQFAHNFANVEVHADGNIWEV